MDSEPSRHRRQQKTTRVRCPVGSERALSFCRSLVCARSWTIGRAPGPTVSGVNSAGTAIVYVDGLNLYGSALKKSAHKWVDLMAASTSLVPAGYALAAVKYFSAELHPSFAEDPASITRQRNYMKALKATGVDVRRGTFMVPSRWRTIVPDQPWSERMRPAPSPQIEASLVALEASSARPMKVMVQLPEEKFTDVAIGVELVDDFHRRSCDMAVLITNDADLQPAIAKVVEQGHHVHVVSPAPTVGRHLRRVASTSTAMPPTCLRDHQFPDEFTVAGERFSRPNAWKGGK